MTREEAITLFEKQLTAARVVLDSGFGSNPGENDILYRRRKEMAEIALSALRSVSREQVENYLYRITYDLLEGVVEEKAQGMSVRQEDKELIATLYKYLFVGLMLDWIKGDMKGDPQVMVQKLELVIHGSVAAALNRMRTDKPASNGAE